MWKAKEVLTFSWCSGLFTFHQRLRLTSCPHVCGFRTTRWFWLWPAKTNKQKKMFRCDKTDENKRKRKTMGPSNSQFRFGLWINSKYWLFWERINAYNFPKKTVSLSTEVALQLKWINGICLLRKIIGIYSLPLKSQYYVYFHCQPIWFPPPKLQNLVKKKHSQNRSRSKIWMLKKNVTKKHPQKNVIKLFIFTAFGGENSRTIWLVQKVQINLYIIFCLVQK